MRDSVPLQGETPAEVVSQLVNRVFGPLQPRRTQIVLDYHGLLTGPAASAADIARRHHVTAPTVYNNAAAVRAAGARQPLSPEVLIEAGRASTPQDDHLARIRIAATLGTRPPAPPPPVDQSPSWANNTVAGAQVAVGKAGLRVLSEAGPLPLPVIARAVARGRRFRTRHPLSDTELAAALTAAGCTADHDDRWHPPANVVPSARDQTIITRSAGRDLTRKHMISILIDAGYSRNSAEGRMSPPIRCSNAPAPTGTGSSPTPRHPGQDLQHQLTTVLLLEVFLRRNTMISDQPDRNDFGGRISYHYNGWSGLVGKALEAVRAERDAAAVHAFQAGVAGPTIA